MLKSVFPYPRSSPSWLDDGKRVVSWGPWIDTGVLYRGLGYDNESNKLQDLIGRYGLQEELDELELPIARREEKVIIALYTTLLPPRCY